METWIETVDAEDGRGGYVSAHVPWKRGLRRSAVALWRFGKLALMFHGNVD